MIMPRRLGVFPWRVTGVPQRHDMEEMEMAKRRSASGGGKKSGSRKYGAKSGQKVERAMHEMKRGKLKSGRSGKKVKSRKQAVAIGLSEARASGAKVPKKKAGGRSRRSSTSTSRSRS